MIKIIALLIVAVGFSVASFIVSYLNNKLMKKIERGLHSLTVAGEDMFNDNQLNTVFIQKSLDMLSEAGYEPDITVDDNGQRWIAAKVDDNTNVNVIKLSKDLFQSRDWSPIEKIMKNEINEVIPALKEQIANNKEKKENA